MAKTTPKRKLKTVKTVEPAEPAEDASTTTEVDDIDEEEDGNPVDSSDDEDSDDENTEEADGEGDEEEQPVKPAEVAPEVVKPAKVYKDGRKREPFEQIVFEGAPAKGIVLGPSQPNYVRGFVTPDGYVVLSQDVYRASRPAYSMRWVFTLEFNAGSRIHESRVVLVEDAD